MWMLFWLGCDAPAGPKALGSEDSGSAPDTETAETGRTDTAECVPAAEVCDGLDQDCDGLVDDGAVDAPSWYTDADADGWGDDTTAVTACDAPEGTVARGGDCDDADPLRTTRCDAGEALGEPIAVLTAEVARVLVSPTLLDGGAVVAGTRMTDAGEPAGVPVVGGAALAVYGYPGEHDAADVPLVDGDGAAEPLLAFDADGDGIDDLLVATWAGGREDHGEGWTPLVGAATVHLHGGALPTGGGLAEPWWSATLATTVETIRVAADTGPSLTGADDTALVVADYAAIWSFELALGAPEPIVLLGADAVGVVAEDLDGDGVGDLVGVDHDEAKVYLGPFSGEARGDRDEDLTWITEGYGVVALAAGDLDADGVAELVFAQRDGLYLLPWATGGGDVAALGTTHLVAADGESVTEVSLAVGDSDTDGDADLAIGAAGRDEGWVWVLRGPIAGTIELGSADAYAEGAPGDRLGAGVAFGEPGDLFVGVAGRGEVWRYELP